MRKKSVLMQKVTLIIIIFKTFNSFQLKALYSKDLPAIITLLSMNKESTLTNVFISRLYKMLISM